jgi:hypothetical protein
MANMTISDLRPAGSDLFADSENFLQELTEQEIGNVLGGVLADTLYANSIHDSSCCQYQRNLRPAQIGYTPSSYCPPPTEPWYNQTQLQLDNSQIAQQQY